MKDDWIIHYLNAVFYARCAALRIEVACIGPEWREVRARVEREKRASK